MQARVQTVAFQGVEVVPVDVQVMIAPGNLGFPIVGLADKAVGESRERVRSALRALGLALPPQRIAVNLSPADLAKEGSHYDLPIALALLTAMGVIPKEALSGVVALGELALDGGLTRVPGILPAALHASRQGLGLICPAACGGEAAWAGDHLELLAAPSLLALINHVRGQQSLPRPQGVAAEDVAVYPDLADIKGQETAKRVLEVAAAGGHNLFNFSFIDPMIRPSPRRSNAGHKRGPASGEAKTLEDPLADAPRRPSEREPKAGQDGREPAVPKSAAHYGIRHLPDPYEPEPSGGR